MSRAPKDEKRIASYFSQLFSPGKSLASAPRSSFPSAWAPAQWWRSCSWWVNACSTSCGPAKGRRPDGSASAWRTRCRMERRIGDTIGGILGGDHIIFFLIKWKNHGDRTNKFCTWALGFVSWWGGIASDTRTWPFLAILHSGYST